jgi:hypothetical protein
VLISVTDFQSAHRRDLPGIYLAGNRLRRHWPELPGAVGMWLWTEPWQGRCGSVSVWRDKKAMHGFIGLPDHVAIMRRYRDRGTTRSTTWTAPAVDRGAIWSRAWQQLLGVELHEAAGEE